MERRGGWTRRRGQEGREGMKGGEEDESREIQIR